MHTHENTLTDPTWTNPAQWPAGSDTFVEAFAKGLLVMTSFAQDRTLSLADISRRTGLPRAGVRRLLHTLVALGIARQEGVAFMLTPRALQLGHAYLSSLPLRDVAQPVIDALAREADEIISISVLHEASAVYIARAEFTSGPRRSLPVGSRLNVYCTSMGRVLLAGLPTDACLALLSNTDRRSRTAHTITELPALMQEIDKVRQQGYSQVIEEVEIGSCGLAVPIRGASGDVVAALNVTTNLARRAPEALLQEMLPRLIKSAEQIGQNLPVGIGAQAA
jgi:IclR family pca regulon transcriptional regulator